MTTEEREKWHAHLDAILDGELEAAYVASHVWESAGKLLDIAMQVDRYRRRPPKVEAWVNLTKAGVRDYFETEGEARNVADACMTHNPDLYARVAVKLTEQEEAQ